MQPDINAADRGEVPLVMEPLLLGDRHRGVLTDLTLDLTQKAVLYRGELPRGDANVVVGTGERQARRIVSALLEKGVLTSHNPRAPLRLVFPAALAGNWMPGLFPGQVL